LETVLLFFHFAPLRCAFFLWKTKAERERKTKKKYVAMGGNATAARVACAFTEVAAIYPIKSWQIIYSVQLL